MAQFAPAIAGVLEHEGGLVDNPRDPGGVTNFGISQQQYPQVNIRYLTREEAETIYERDYWRFGGLTSQRLANKMLDIYVNLPPAHAIRLLQIALTSIGISHVVIDGVFGDHTISSANLCCSNPDGSGANEDKLIDELKAQLMFYYLTDVRNDDSKFPFLSGWIRRAVKG